MKTSQWAAVSAAVLSICALAPTSVLAAPSTIPSQPQGMMSAYPTIVQTGTKPTLTWNILYPSKVSDVAVINPPGSITVTQNNTYVSVQPIGSGVTACESTQVTTAYNTEARISVNGGAYKQLFYGTQAQVEPAYSLYVKKHSANTTIDFGGRYVKNGSWSSFFTTRSSNFQVVALVNGQTIPTTFPLYQSVTLANYLRPYLDSTGKVNIGPMSVLILMELGQTNRSMTCFDLQDQILLVTFSTKHPNNGHGNNLDGVDVSNPGQGSGGPNGAIDLSGGVDDEIR